MTSTAKQNNVTGLVVSVTDQGEKDRLAVLVTENGRLFVNFRGVRAQTAKLKRFAAPFVFAEFSLTGSTVKGASMIDAHRGLTTDVYRAAAAAMIAETLEKTAEIGGDLKEELETALVALKLSETAGTFPYTAALWFFIKLFLIEGADAEDFPLPLKQRAFFKTLENADPRDLDALELLPAEILSGLYTAEKIMRNAFDFRLNSVKEALKLSEGR